MYSSSNPVLSTMGEDRSLDLLPPLPTDSEAWQKATLEWKAKREGRRATDDEAKAKSMAAPARKLHVLPSIRHLHPYLLPSKDTSDVSASRYPSSQSSMP